MSEDLLFKLNILSRRFSGVDLTVRRFKPKEWPARCRCENVTTKDGNADYRVSGWGDSPEEAIRDLLKRIEEVDEKVSKSFE